MSDLLHRILTGNALTPRQLAAGGLFVLVWFAMDLVQFLDFVWEKLR